MLICVLRYVILLIYFFFFFFRNKNVCAREPPNYNRFLVEIREKTMMMATNSNVCMKPWAIGGRLQLLHQTKGFSKFRLLIRLRRPKAGDMSITLQKSCRNICRSSLKRRIKVAWTSNLIRLRIICGYSLTVWSWIQLSILKQRKTWPFKQKALVPPANRLKSSSLR